MNSAIPEAHHRIQNAYTDAPRLRTNLILGSFQVFFWLFFHPSAWHNQVDRIGSDLPPSFCLAQLSWDHWRKPALHRLLLAGCVVLPLLTSVVVGLVLWVVGEPGATIARGVTYGLVFGVTGGVIIGIASCVAGGIAFSVTGAVTAGVVGAVVGSLTGLMTGVWAGGVAGSVASSMASPGPTRSLAKQMGGVAVGVLIGAVAYIVAAGVAGTVQGGAMFGVGYGVVFSVVAGVASGLTGSWRTGRWQHGMVAGVVSLVAGLVAADVVGVATGRIAFGIRGGLEVGVLFALPYVLAERTAGPRAGAIAGAIGCGGLAAHLAIDFVYLQPILPLSLVGILLGLTLDLWRPVLLYIVSVAGNALLHRVDERRIDSRPSLLRCNSAFWDEHQRLRLFGLEDHVVLAAEHKPVEGRAALAYLATSRQRWAAQAAQIELEARQLERCTDVITIAHAHPAAGALSGPASALLRSFSRVSQDVEAAIQQASAYNQRLALSAVEDRLDDLLRELTRSSERYAVRFYPIADSWRQIVADHVHLLAEEAEARQEIDSPYIIGVPLTERQEIFVGRTDVSAYMEQLLLDRRRPPLLLYGQRRMGKTSLLNNLGRLLPSTIVPLFVDLQGPASRANDHAGLLYNIARGIANSAQRQRDLILPALPREVLMDDPFTRFDEWLDQVEQALGENTALLALDEFEAIDSAITKGRFEEEAVLGTLRHLIQHRPRFKVLLAGSHTLDELQRWASYLINVQVVHIGYLKEAEAQQLIERPAKDFALRYEPDASQRVVDLTRGHPFLVQLLCAEIVAQKNEQPPALRRLACLGDVESAVPEALSHGSFFFADIQQNQVSGTGREVLRWMAAQGEGTAVSREALAFLVASQDELEQTLASLARRELIEQADGGYRFQVELIRRWFAQGNR